MYCFTDASLDPKSRLGQPAKLDEPTLSSKVDSLGAIGRMQLHQNTRDMIFDGTFGEHELVGDIAITGSQRKQPKHIRLTQTEPLEKLTQQTNTIPGG